MEKGKIKFDITTETKKEYLTKTNGCIGFIDIYRFSSSSLGLLVKKLVDNKHKTTKNLKKKLLD